MQECLISLDKSSTNFRCPLGNRDAAYTSLKVHFETKHLTSCCNDQTRLIFTVLDIHITQRIICVCSWIISLEGVHRRRDNYYLFLNSAVDMESQLHDTILIIDIIASSQGKHNNVLNMKKTGWNRLNKLKNLIQTANLLERKTRIPIRSLLGLM